MLYDKEHYLLKQKALEMNHIESSPTTEQALSSFQPDAYLNTMIELYHQSQADYRGQRTGEDQQFIAEYASEEADEYFDQQLHAITSLALPRPGEPFVMPKDEASEASITLGGLRDGVSLKEMRNSWRQLWVGANILTHRLKRDSAEFNQAEYEQLLYMPDAQKKLVIDELFSRFQDLNALRFGVVGSGVMRGRWTTNPDTGRPEKVKSDADKARSDKEVAQNAARRRYNAGRQNDRPAIHPAGKITPENFRKLRKDFPEIDMDTFAKDVAFRKNIAEVYHSEEED